MQANYNTCSTILLLSACSDITALVTAILQRIITGKNRGHEAIVVVSQFEYYAVAVHHSFFLSHSS